MGRPIRIIALTDAGQQLAVSLTRHMPDAETWFKPAPFTEKVQAAFQRGDALIMICAAGIVMRTLGPIVQTKHDDPPVLLLDELGQFVIPLLSGHEGGANDLASRVADYLEAQLVITTANRYLAPVYTVGMGCERGCSERELEELLHESLARAGLNLEQVESINSIALKSDEQGLLQLASSLSKPYRTYDKTELAGVEHLLSTRSEYVYDTVGVYGVAESAALWAAQQITGQRAELALTKVKTTRATCAIARSYTK